MMHRFRGWRRLGAGGRQPARAAAAATVRNWSRCDDRRPRGVALGPPFRGGLGSHEAGQISRIRRAGSAGWSRVEKARPGQDATGNSRWFSSSLNRCSAAGDVQVQYYGAGGASTSPSRPGRLDGLVYPAPRQPQSHGLSLGIPWEYGYLDCLVMRRCRSAVETVGPARGSSGQAARGKAWRGRKLEGKWENWGPSLARPCQGSRLWRWWKSGSALTLVDVDAIRISARSECREVEPG